MISPHGRDLIVITVLFTLLSLLSIVLRFYTILKISRRPLRLDDYIVTLSTVSMLAVAVAVIVGIRHGTGFRIDELEWSDVAVQIKVQISTLFTWTISTCTCKLAVLFMYLDIFRTDTNFRRVTWVLIALTLCYSPVFIPFFMTQCYPVSAAWDPVLSKTNCRPLKIQELASVAVHLGLDSAIVIAPLPVIWKLKMPRCKKIGVSLAFSVGVGVIATMVWRMIYTTRPDHGSDFTYELFYVSVQAQLEIWLGILAANIPTLGPLMNRYTGKISSYASSVGCKQKKDSSKLGHRITLKTFGSSGNKDRSARQDFYRLDDWNRESGSRQGIMMNRETRVSVEIPGDDTVLKGYTASVQANKNV
ncbi:hypothetical protein F4806DRAFT_502256 [Annulohypoxylon nitens]|nr:hypothetical protein F4806DRAFT_502256 [Annulohypoxylon nitens]